MSEPRTRTKYSYDLEGRRITAGGSFARTGLPLPVGQTAYNANNQLSQWGTANLFYDANGNMTSSGTDGYTWDARNRLVSTLSGSSFQYDAFGHRQSKAIGATTTNFLYDGANVVQELSGTTPTANLLSGGLDEYFQRTDSVGTRSFLSDALGSVLGLTDSTGTLQTQYSFEPFGNTSTAGPSSTSSFAYTGRELDGTGLYFNRARYYSPSLQRFISEDPLAFGGGDVNFYAYVRNDPVNLFDPFGLRPGDKYPNAKCAGWNAVNDYNPTSIAENREYGGFIYKNSDGTFSYTDPHVNNDAGIGNDFKLPRFWDIPIPNGTERAGWYHTHAGPPLSEINNDFSPEDMDISDKPAPIGLNGLPGFLGTPKPQVRMYLPSPDNPRHGISFPLNGRNCGCSK
jgi:RHS repeat-associated protein